MRLLWLIVFLAFTGPALAEQPFPDPTSPLRVRRVPVPEAATLIACRDPQPSHERTTACLTAAQQGDREAQERIGDIYNNGDGEPQDKGLALKWYKRAQEQAPPRQRIDQKLAALYLEQNTYKGYRSAIRHLLRAGGPISYIELARIFLKGGPGVPPNYAKAFTFAHAATAWSGLMQNQTEWGAALAIRAEAERHLSDEQKAMAADYAHLWTTTSPSEEWGQ